jgi:hypothetical protein
MNLKFNTNPGNRILLHFLSNILPSGGRNFQILLLINRFRYYLMKGNLNLV